MKFIGLFLMFLSFWGLEREFSFTNLVWFFIGLGFLFSDVIFYAMKKEIDHRNRSRGR